MTFADALRYVTLGLTLYAAGAVAAIFAIRSPVSARHVVPVAAAQVGYMLYVAVDVHQRLGEPLTWRAPAALGLAVLVAMGLTHMAFWRNRVRRTYRATNREFIEEVGRGSAPPQ